MVDSCALAMVQVAKVIEEVQPAAVAIELRHSDEQKHREAAGLLAPLLDQLAAQPMTTHDLLAARLQDLARWAMLSLHAELFLVTGSSGMSWGPRSCSSTSHSSPCHGCMPSHACHAFPGRR
jgi:hypothetical protein